MDKKEPISIQCTDCGEWSKFRADDGSLPRGWREDDKGYHCNKCRGKK